MISVCLVAPFPSSISYRRMVMLALQLNAPRHEVEEGPQAHAAHRRRRLIVVAAARSLFRYMYVGMVSAGG